MSVAPAWLSQTPPAAPPWTPPQQPTGAWATPAGPGGGADLRGWADRHGLTPARLTAGDWAGAVLAVVAGIGAMLVLAVLGVLLVGIPDSPDVVTSQVVAIVAMLVALAFGGSITVDGVSGLGVDGAAGFSIVPLALTVVGLGVLATIFVRRLRASGARTVGDALLQSVRVWSVLMGSLLVVCLVGRFQVGSDSRSDGGSGLGTPGLHVTTGIGGTLFFGSCWLASVLVLATVWRLPVLLPPRARAWRDRVGGPVAGAAVAVVLSCVVIVVVAVVSTIVQTSGSSSSVASGPRGGVVVAGLLLLGPNLVQMAFGMAVGAPLSAASILSTMYSTSSGRFGLSGPSVSLLDLTDRQPVFWLAILAIAAAIVVGGLLAALHTASPEEARRSFWRVGLALGAILLVIAMSTSMSGSGAIFGVQGTASVHLDYLVAPLFGLVWGALGGWVGALLAPGVPPGMIAGVRNHVQRARWFAYAGGTARQEPLRAGPVGGPA